MIEKYDDDVFQLVCDRCGESCSELFNTFVDAVAYKTNRENGWNSVKDKDEVWHELCPSCNRLENIVELRGIRRGSAARNTELNQNTAKLANLSAEDFKGF